MRPTRHQNSSRFFQHILLFAVFVAVFAVILPPLLVGLLDLEPLTKHMARHVIIMNLIAPLAAISGARIFAASGKIGETTYYLGPAMVAQLIALWFWHIPFAHHAAMASNTAHAFMVLTLTVSSVWFWIAVFSHRGSDRWRSLVALLFTGKLFCLLGALITFAPNALYGDAQSAAAIADQQTAGLLMLAVCPLTYVAAGIVISAQWLNDLSIEHKPLASPPAPMNKGGAQ